MACRFKVKEHNFDICDYNGKDNKCDNKLHNSNNNTTTITIVQEHELWHKTKQQNKETREVSEDLTGKYPMKANLS